MSLARIGLVRRSDDIADVEHQYAVLEPICERIFEEQNSRRRLIGNRPELIAALRCLSPGDRLVVVKAQCLGPGVFEGICTLTELLGQGFSVSVLEGVAADDCLQRKLALERACETMEVFREHERRKIKRGIQAARDRHRAIGRPRVVDRAKRERILLLRGQGETLRVIAEMVGVSVGTVHNVLADAERGRDAQPGTMGMY